MDVEVAETKNRDVGDGTDVPDFSEAPSERMDTRESRERSSVGALSEGSSGETALTDSATLMTQCGIHALTRAAYAFDSLEVSVRAALPSSSVPSDVLALAVASLHDSYVSAFRDALGDVVLEADVAWFPCGPEAYREVLVGHSFAMTCEEQELQLDEKLRDLSKRLEQVDAEEPDLRSTIANGRKVCSLLNAIADEVEDIPDIAGFRENVLQTNRVMVDMLELLHEESERVPLLAKVKRAVEKAKRIAIEGPSGIQDDELTALQRGVGIDESSLAQLAIELTRPVESV
jgi:hypothetical protein